MTFKVLFTSQIRAELGEAHEYAPDGEEYECSRETAIARFHAVLESGKQSLLVFGLPVKHVWIEDTSKRGAKGAGTNNQIMLSQYTDDEFAVGPWSDNAPQDDDEAPSAEAMPVVAYVMKMFDAVREFMIVVTLILSAILFNGAASLWFSILATASLAVGIALFGVRRKRLAIAIVKDSEMYQRASEQIGALAESLHEKNAARRKEVDELLEVRSEKPKASKKLVN